MQNNRQHQQADFDLATNDPERAETSASVRRKKSPEPPRNRAKTETRGRGGGGAHIYPKKQWILFFFSPFMRSIDRTNRLIDPPLYIHQQSRDHVLLALINNGRNALPFQQTHTGPPLFSSQRANNNGGRRASSLATGGGSVLGGLPGPLSCVPQGPTEGAASKQVGRRGKGVGLSVIVVGD
jgi:hypothetical protein